MAKRATIPIVIDGILTEWAGANSVQFHGATNSVIAYVLWDPTNLYVAFQVKDTQLNATQTKRDAPNLYLDDAVEIYIDTKDARNTQMQTHDYQFLVNLLNTQGDLRGTGSGKTPSWNGIWKSAVTLQGTLNANADVDSGYTVEIAIPWAQIGVTPKSGMLVAMDLTCDDRDASTFDYFDWAGIAPNSYAQPNLWKVVQLQ